MVRLRRVDCRAELARADEERDAGLGALDLQDRRIGGTDERENACVATIPDPALQVRVHAVAVVFQWMLLCYGMTLIITGARITAGVRRLVASWSATLGHGIACPMCVGFWVGAGLTLLGLGPFVEHHATVRAVLNGFTASAVCWIAHVVLARLGAETL